jgi:perosamine synthetase
MGDFIPIARVELTAEDIEAAVEVLKSGSLVQGRRTQEFEKAFAEQVGAEHAIAVSSGTSALHVAYLAGLDEGSEVIVPSFSHISTASMVCFAGCQPVFCDIDPRTFTLSLDDARAKMTEKTKAIAPVHLFGNACDMDEIMNLAAERDFLVVWDAAQAHGTGYRGRDIGGFDHMVTYSFYPTKNMTTGEGGMITTNSVELAERCRLLRAHWQTSKYYHPEIGLNYRMTEVEAAIGLQQLQRLDQSIARRRANAAFLTKGLSEIKGIVTPLVKEGVEHSYHQYTILVEPDGLGCTRDEFVAALKERGIGTGVHYPRPIHKQPAFIERCGDLSLPVVEGISERILSLPVFPQLQEAELERIVQAIRDITSGIAGS